MCVLSALGAACILPEDIGMFEALPWHKHIWAIPDNVMMFAAEGRDAVRKQLV